jgi:hypothetical protein
MLANFLFVVQILKQGGGGQWESISCRTRASDTGSEKRSR